MRNYVNKTSQDKKQPNHVTSLLNNTNILFFLFFLLFLLEYVMISLIGCYFSSSLELALS
jgi:hypothetical protein